MCRILMFDKDDGIREVSKSLLEDQGFEVVTSDDAKKSLEAIYLSDREGRPFDLVIAHVFSNNEKDYDENWIDGKWLVQEMVSRKMHPRIPVIITIKLRGEGPSDSVEDYLYHQYGISGLIQRPIDFDKVLTKIATVLLIRECGAF